MDPRFLNLYSKELSHLRGVVREFAEASPKIAGRLGLSASENEPDNQDPYVERLLDGFAFLTGRIQLKFENEFPRFTEALLETIYPDLLCPVPAMSIARFEPDYTQTSGDGRLLPRDSVIVESVEPDEEGQKTACRFSTAHDVELWPLKVEDVFYRTRDFLQLGLERTVRGEAAFQIRLRATQGTQISSIKAKRLTFHLSGGESAPWMIYEEIFSKTTAIVVRSTATGGSKWTPVILDKSHLRPVGFADSEALLPVDSRSFPGYRYLREYFALPERFLFLEITGLDKCLPQCSGDQFEIIIVLSTENHDLEEKRPSASNFSLFSTPVINLFGRKATPISLAEHRSDLPAFIEPRPRDYEIFKIKSVLGHGLSGEVRQKFRPFYLRRESDRGQEMAFFNVHRTVRPMPEKGKEFSDRREYAGSDVSLSIVDAHGAPYPAALLYLEVQTLCTNAHLPWLLAKDTKYELEGEPHATVSFLRKPTAPRPAPLGGEHMWRLISHLSCNYYSLSETPEEAGAPALKQLLTLYAPEKNSEARRRIDAVRSIATEEVMERISKTGPIRLDRGLGISLTISEKSFPEGGIFVFGAVLNEFFANYVTLNSFTKTTLLSESRGVIMQWPPRNGKRPLI